MHIHEVYGHACNLFVLPIYSTLLILHAARRASERVNERTEPGRTDERTNQRTNLDERTNLDQRTNLDERNGTGNQRICNTAQPYEYLMMKQKKSHLSERHVSVSRPLLGGTAYRLRLPYPSVTVRKYDYAVPLALYPAKMYQ